MARHTDGRDKYERKNCDMRQEYPQDKTSSPDSELGQNRMQLANNYSRMAMLAMRL